MGSPSAIITLGFGSWGSMGEVVTLGLGSGEEGEAIAGPYRVAAMQAYVAGVVASDSNLAGVYRSQGFVAGTTEGDGSP